MSWIFKVALGGESGVGKSTLVYRLSQGRYTDNIRPTIGVDFLVHKVLVHHPIRGVIPVTLQVWDLGGQSQFQQLHSAYIRGALCGIIMHDLSRPDTMLELPKWAKILRIHDLNLPLVLVGSKVDLVNLESAKALISSSSSNVVNNFAHLLTSSINGYGIKELFEAIALHLLKLI
jgi:small GTP-binding protein